MQSATADPITNNPRLPLIIEAEAIEALRTVYDPEIPVNIYEMGLIYELKVSPEGAIYARMTLTSPMCPVAETLPPEVEEKLRQVPGVTNVKLDLVWEPPWSLDLMSEEAKLQLNLW